MGFKGPFTPSPCLWRISRDHLYVQLLHSSCELGRFGFIHLVAAGGRGPVLSGPIRVQGGKKSFAFNDVPDAPETAPSAFLRDKKHGVVLIGSIVQSDDESPHLTLDPLVLRAVLVKHHAGIRGPRTLLAVCSPPGRLLDHAPGLKGVLDPGVGTTTPMGATVPAVKMLDGKPEIPFPIKLHQLEHLVQRSFAHRLLGQAPIKKTLKPGILVSTDVTAKSPVTDSQ